MAHEHPRENEGLTLSGDWQFALERRELAEPGPGDVLVEIDVAGICGSDVHMAAYTADEDRQWRVPGVFGGHEGAGRVVLAPASSTLRPGDAVLIYHYEACWECEACLAGYLQWCPRRRALSMDRDGAIARYVTVDARNCLPIPDGFTLDDGACLACTAGTAASAVMKVIDPLPARALVVGLGPLGLASAQILSGLGVEVSAIEPLAARREFALARGIVDTVERGEDGPFRGSWPVVVETSGSDGGRRAAIEAAGRGGRVALVGMGSADVELSAQRVIFSELLVSGSNIWPISAFPELIELYRRAQVRPGELVSRAYSLADAAEAMRAARAAPGKLVVRPAL